MAKSAQSHSQGAVPSSRDVDLASLQPGDWVLLEDRPVNRAMGVKAWERTSGGAFELVLDDPLADPEDGDTGERRLSQAEAASRIIGVPFRRPRTDV